MMSKNTFQTHWREVRESLLRDFNIDPVDKINARRAERAAEREFATALSLIFAGDVEHGYIYLERCQKVLDEIERSDVIRANARGDVEVAWRNAECLRTRAHLAVFDDGTVHQDLYRQAAEGIEAFSITFVLAEE